MPESKKVVIKVSFHDDSEKRKALKTVSSLSGIESVAMDMKERKMTIIGDIDPVDVVVKLKKWYPEIVTVGPAKEEKKAEPGKSKEDEEKKKKEEEEALRKRWEAYYRDCNPYQQQNCGSKCG